MELINYGSSSKGNMYILQGIKESLMLDCGVNCKGINEQLKTYNIVGTILTHSHGDHINGIKNGSYLGNNKFYASNYTFKSLPKLYSFQKMEIEEMKAYDIGEEFKVIPISVSHDVPCFAYLIKNKKTNITVLYATDLGYSDNLTFKNVHTFIIECNYIRNDIEEYNAKTFRVDSLSGHLALEDTINILKRSIGINTRNIFLCHITHSENDFKRYEELVMESINNPKISIKALNNRILGIEKFKL